MVVAIERLNAASSVDDLVTLRVAWGVENGRELDDSFAERFVSWFEKERDRREFFVAYDESRPVGMVNLVLFERMPSIGGPGGGWGYLSNMYVVPERRNAGVGAKLIEALIEVAETNRLERIVLKPTGRSVPLYERQGFRGDNQLMVRI